MEKIALPRTPDISISVVSHLQLDLVVQLLDDLAEYCQDLNFEFILTLNLAEELPFALKRYIFPIRLIRNAGPIGFGANHNQAFAKSSGSYFCVLNPDIRICSNPFLLLMNCLQDPCVGVAAPLVLGPDGCVEDSARQFPNPLKILGKFFNVRQKPAYAGTESIIYPDWVGGMFMLIPKKIFERLGGFDERYFLYYEDVDLCARLKLLGYRSLLSTKAQVVHHAQRSSHANFRYLRWHLRSMMRFFLSPVYWRLLFSSRR
jgi:hypothetical protein